MRFFESTALFVSSTSRAAADLVSAQKLAATTPGTSLRGASGHAVTTTEDASVLRISAMDRTFAKDAAALSKSHQQQQQREKEQTVRALTEAETGSITEGDISTFVGFITNTYNLMVYFGVVEGETISVEESDPDPDPSGDVVDGEVDDSGDGEDEIIVLQSAP